MLQSTRDFMECSCYCVLDCSLCLFLAKMRLIAGLLVYTCSIVAADVASDFISNEIVPDALDKAPNQLLPVSYGDKTIKFGEELTPKGVRDSPTIGWKFEPSSYYTLIMTNLDPMSRQNPQYREFLHWLVTNIPGDDFTAGETIAEYAGAGPPIDGGVHRILFTVYKQPGKLSFSEPRMHDRQLGIRIKFSQRKFATKYELGDPIAGNMYTAQYDDTVPQLHSEFMNGKRDP